MSPTARALQRCSLSALALAVALAPAAARADERGTQDLELRIVRGALPAGQRVLRVTKGSALRLRVSSDAPGELHLHGYRLAATLAPGKEVELAFTAHATGRFRFEWHPAGERAAPGAHHGPPLGVLEVHPR